MKLINFLANLIWILLGGIWTTLVWCIIGLFLCITVIGIPLGLQCFKFAKLSLAPFGKKVKLNFSKHPIANILWLIFIGWEMCLAYLVACVILCITIIGITAGKQAFKLCALSLAPFGADVK